MGSSFSHCQNVGFQMFPLSIPANYVLCHPSLWSLWFVPSESSIFSLLIFNLLVVFNLLVPVTLWLRLICFCILLIKFAYCNCWDLGFETVSFVTAFCLSCLFLSFNSVCVCYLLNLRQGRANYNPNGFLLLFCLCMLHFQPISSFQSVCRHGTSFINSFV